ncbi:MAG: RnfABCDGE type electron transport complex subunit B [Clostridiales bacterium]|jgi:RnfABCDGE-type electron transport complex B subunit|nr:RnfABCDGE type electron transport complex subunit B [Clostridiales bacterium]
METYVIPILIFSGIGLIAGILLHVASKTFEVKVDEKIEQINEALPQINCGACGYAGCADYANAVAENDVPANLCKPGGNETARKISQILGKDVVEIVPELAVVHCNGDCNATTKKFIFDGIQSCVAAKRFYNGDGVCTYGCLGLGDCVAVCEYGAISIKDSIAYINKSACVSCGKCVKACPNQLISLRPVSKHIDVACSSRDNGKITKLNCKNGCIGCKICEKKCLSDAIKVVDYCAEIDYEKCTVCGACYEACPTGAITNCSIKI